MCFSEFVSELIKSLFYEKLSLNVSIETINEAWDRRARITIECDRLEDNERRLVEATVLQMRENHRFSVIESVKFTNASVVLICKAE